MSRTVPVQTSDEARFHTSMEGVLESDRTPYYCLYFVKEDDGELTSIDEILDEVEGRRVHIIVFVEP